MKWDTREPCKSCPYRKDAPLAMWDIREFIQVLANDADELRGGVYGCHATRHRQEPSVCAGWLVDQKRRGLPSIQLRLLLLKHTDAVNCLEEVSDGGHELFASIEEMVRANAHADGNPHAALLRNRFGLRDEEE